MFADNQKISPRQMRRLLIFDLLGVGTLLLPCKLAQLCGTRGIWCIAIGTIAAFLYMLLLGRAMRVMRMDLFSYARSKVLHITLSVIMTMLAGFCLKIFVDLIRRSLVPDEGFLIIGGVIIIVSVYAVSGGMESRARVYELLFYFVLIPLILMLSQAAVDVKPVYVLQPGAGQLSELCQGSGLVFMSFSVLFFTLFFPGAVSEARARKIERSAMVALLVSATIILAVYIILVGTFGAAALAKMRFPAVTLMSTVQITGNFFKRTDALMCGIWFFTLFSVLNMSIFYGAKAIETISSAKLRRTTALIGGLAFVVALGFEYEEDLMEKFIKLMGVIGVPLFLLIPLVIVLKGCNSKELESRCFPMLMALDSNGQMVSFSYIFPKVGEDKVIAPVQEADFQRAKTVYEANLSKLADLNHVKIILLSESYIGDEKQMEQLLSYAGATEEIPRNTYVCVTDDVQQILATEAESGPDIGTYIEELIENHPLKEQGNLVTIGNLIDESSNNLMILYLPYLTVKNDTIVWEKYYELDKKTN